VTGEADQMDVPKSSAKPDASNRLTAAESALLATYRRLPPKYQRRLRDQADEFATLARSTRAKKG
jgi:hypothetical protein